MITLTNAGVYDNSGTADATARVTVTVEHAEANFVTFPAKPQPPVPLLMPAPWRADRRWRVEWPAVVAPSLLVVPMRRYRARPCERGLGTKNFHRDVR